jgi:hypothetical protein
MNFLNKILLGAVFGGAMFGSMAVAQIPTDNPYVKAHPYFSKMDKGDYSPAEQADAVVRLKDATKFEKGWIEEDLDKIYGRLSSGPMPKGFFRGTVITPIDSGSNTFVGLGIPYDPEMLQNFGSMLWKGKYFDSKTKFLKNFIDCKTLPLPVRGAGIVPGLSTCNDSGEGINKKNLKFPAKVFCGQSLLDGRRESIIIDYAYGDDIDRQLWQILTDPIPGRKGLSVRDEIRMVRPGFYLGRAYLKGSFLLWFTLEYDNEATLASDRAEDLTSNEDACWVGYQRQRQRIELGTGKGYSAYTNKGILQ